MRGVPNDQILSRLNRRNYYVAAVTRKNSLEREKERDLSRALAGAGKPDARALSKTRKNASVLLYTRVGITSLTAVALVARRKSSIRAKFLDTASRICVQRGCEILSSITFLAARDTRDGDNLYVLVLASFPLRELIR